MSIMTSRNKPTLVIEVKTEDDLRKVLQSKSSVVKSHQTRIQKSAQVFEARNIRNGLKK